ncbi:MAG: SusD/RagB family nutrient-binding outer membrane lipoprotein [Chitinophagaceae bacterium]
MKTRYIAVLLASLSLTGMGCKKFLDVNKDPNNPLSVSEGLILSPVEVTLSTNIVGGFTGTTTAYWMQNLSLNQPSPNVETYRILPSDVDNSWSFYTYPNALKNLNDMINQAEAAGHMGYAAIGKALTAYTLAITTDLWGDIPYSQAFQISTNLKPTYDSQESIYTSIQGLLDSAIYYTNQTPSAIEPGTDDYIYNGDMDKWRQFIYFLKARYYMRLSNAPGHTAAAQADLALAAIANAFTANEDNATVPYPGTPSAENPWYENTLPGAGGVVLGQYFVNTLKTKNDPRLPIIATVNNGGEYVGRPAGIDAVPDPSDFSYVNTFYGGYLDDDDAGAAAPLFLGTYAEQLFIEAEATFAKSGAAAADPIYRQAIGAHMDLLKVTAGNRDTYVAAQPALTDANAIQNIIQEKYVADFLSLEAYNDWRRTGFPVLTPAINAYENSPIPTRWPYSQTAILTNPQPQQSAKTTDKVWWDQ